MWSAQEMKKHINFLELLAIKLAIQTFSKALKHKAIHLQVDNMVALTYLLKMGSTQNLKLAQLTKEIWDHLLQCGITLTAEYLASKLNVTADWESRNSSDSSEWKLAPQSFQRICQMRGTPERNSRSICFEIISSDQDLLFVEARSIEPSSRCFPTKLVPQESLCFSPILHGLKSFEQSPERENTCDDPCNSSLVITIVVPRSNENIHTTTNFIDLEERSLKKPTGRNSSPCPQKILKFVAWTV